MAESKEQTDTITSPLRVDIVEVWGDKTEIILKACQAHIMDAVATELTLHHRYHCIKCLHSDVLIDFFTWLNEEAYVYIVDNWHYDEFLAHMVRWTLDWTKERMLSPCTDGMVSSEIH